MSEYCNRINDKYLKQVKIENINEGPTQKRLSLLVTVLLIQMQMIYSFLDTGK